MGAVWGFIFKMLIDPLGLPIVWWVEWLVLLIIGAVAYCIAYSVVGDLYISGGISTSFSGSLLHWVIRLLLFIIMWAVVYGVIWVGKLIFSNWVVSLSIISVILLIAGAVVISLHRRRGASNA